MFVVQCLSGLGSLPISGTLSTQNLQHVLKTSTREACALEDSTAEPEAISVDSITLGSMRTQSEQSAGSGALGTKYTGTVAATVGFKRGSRQASISLTSGFLSYRFKREILLNRSQRS